MQNPTSLPSLWSQRLLASPGKHGLLGSSPDLGGGVPPTQRRVLPLLTGGLLHGPHEGMHVS